MKKRSKVLVVGASALALAATGGGLAVAGATGGDDANENEVAIQGSELDRASQAALEHLGGGTVSDTEVGDEESYYEVEVTRDDGSQVDVQLDRDFQVVGQEGEPGETEDE